MSQASKGSPVPQTTPLALAGEQQLKHESVGEGSCTNWSITILLKFDIFFSSIELYVWGRGLAKMPLYHVEHVP